MSETCGGCVYDGVPLDGVAVKIDADGQVLLSGPVLFDGYDGEPERTAEVLRDGWLRTHDLGRLDDDGRLQVLGRVDDVVISGGVKVPALAVEQMLARHPVAVDAVAVVGVPDPEWGERVVAVVVAPRRRRTLARAARPRRPRGRGRPGSWSLLEALPLLANGKVDRRRAASRLVRGCLSRARLLDPDADPLPRHHRPRGDAPPRRRRVGRVQPLPGVRRPGRRALVAGRPGGRRRGLARRRCATGSRSTSPCPRSTRPPPTTWSCRSGCTTAKVKVAEPGQARRRRRGPARGGARRPRARRPDPGRRQRRLGRRQGGRRRSGCWTAPPAGWSTSSSRARPSRTWPWSAAGSTCRSPPTSRSAGPRTPTGCATSEAADVAVLKVQPLGGVRACLRIAEDIGLPVVVSSALETSVGIAAGVALAAALPELPYACGLATVQLLTDDVAREPLLPEDGSLPVVRPEVDEARLARLRRERRTGGRTGRRGWPRSGRIGDREHASRATPRPPWPGRCSTSWSAAASRTSCCARARARRRWPSPPTTLAAEGRLTLHVRIDERTAGFLALGLARTSRRPVAVVTTSGTAVANLHPAVLEASHAGLPLVVVTADRPASLRGTGANQTTDQVKVYGGAVRAFADVPAAVPGSPRGRAGPRLAVAGGPHAAHRRRAAAVRRAARCTSTCSSTGPATPDVADGWADPGDGRRRTGAAWTAVAERGARRAAPSRPVRRRCRTVVVAGDDAGPPARVLAEAGGWPLLAEPTSGSRTGRERDPDLPAAARRRRPRRDRIERVVVCGHPTLSRPVTRLLSRDRRRGGRPRAAGRAAGWTDPGHAVEPGRPTPRPWPPRRGPAGLAGGVARPRTPTSATGSTRCSTRRPALTPQHVAGAVARALPARRAARSSAPPTRSATST